MRIKKFEEYCQPYGLDKRTIDYYSNLGLIPYTTKGAANYREYDDTSIDAVKKIVILRDVGLPLKSIKEALSNPSYFTTAVWNSHIKALKEHLAETQKKYEDMIRYAEDLRDSASMALTIVRDFDSPEESRIMTQLSAHLYRKLRVFLKSQEALLAPNNNHLDDDISDLVDTVTIFSQKLDILYEKGYEASSPEMQQLIGRTYQQIMKNYGVIVYYFYTMLEDIKPSDLGVSDDEIEDYELYKTMLGICADWFREAKTIEAALDTATFAEHFKDRIAAFDRIIDDSSFDVLVDIIKSICEIPNDALENGFSAEPFKGSYRMGFELANEETDLSEEDDKEISAIEEYLLSAISIYAENKKATATRSEPK